MTETLKKYGMDITENEGPVSVTIHRSWINTKAFFSLDINVFILEEVRNRIKAVMENSDYILNNC